MIALVVFTDGRWDLLEQTIASAREHLHGPITSVHLIVDGKCEWPAYAAGREQLAAAFPDAIALPLHHDERLGFGGSIAAAWRRLSAALDSRFVFHLEDDFTFNRDIDLAAMMTVLTVNTDLVQMALRRQPCNDAEEAAGGLVELHADAYQEVTGKALVAHDPAHPMRLDEVDVAWLVHRLYFTTNPSLYRRSLCDRGWPEGPRSEGMFTHEILAEDPHARFGLWGSRDSGEWITHIGTNRVGTGY